MSFFFKCIQSSYFLSVMMSKAWAILENFWRLLIPIENFPLLLWLEYYYLGKLSLQTQQRDTLLAFKLLLASKPSLHPNPSLHITQHEINLKLSVGLTFSPPWWKCTNAAEMDLDASCMFTSRMHCVVSRVNRDRDEETKREFLYIL